MSNYRSRVADAVRQSYAAPQSRDRTKRRRPLRPRLCSAPLREELRAALRPGNEEPSLVLPCRLALFEEGADAFFGIAGQHVFGHHFRCIAIGVCKAHLGLAVECRLADSDGVGGFA